LRAVSDRPTVTVVLPALNAEDYIGVCLASLTRQFEDPSELEVLLVDDGSTDSTGDVAQGYRTKGLPGLVVLRNDTPIGAAECRNRALGGASGRYIAYVDADDWLAPGHLPSLVRSIRHHGCGFVRTDQIRITGSARVLRRAPEPRRGVVLPARDSILPVGEQTMVDYAYVWAGLYDASMAQDGFLSFESGLQVAADRPWVWRLHLDGPSFAVVDAPGYCYRRGVTDSLTQILDLRRLDFVPAFLRAKQILDQDRDAELFLPKLARAVTAIVQHHLLATPDMAPSVVDELVRKSRQLLRAFPDEQLRGQLEKTPQERQFLLGRLLDGTFTPDDVPHARDERRSA